MDLVRRHFRPALRNPKAIIAFEGWNDACEAASGAIHYLLGRRRVDEPFATIEPEEFFNFQEHRPEVEIDAGGTRSLTWPETRFYAVPMDDAPSDLVLVVGEEPSFRWKTFSRTVARVLNDHDVDRTVLLGAYIGQASHRRPVPLAGAGTDPATIAAYGLDASDYEGPTGIVGVLVEALREIGMPTLSIWAATPPYLAANANPAAMLALLSKASDVVGVPFDLRRLTRLADDFVQRVDEALDEEDEDLVDYISSLDSSNVDEASLGELVSEIEDFLKGQG